MFLGERHGFALEVLPEVPCQRNILAARSQAFNQQRLQSCVLLPLLRIAEQRTEIFADIAYPFVASCSPMNVFSDSGSDMVTVVMATLLLLLPSLYQL
jgi:hypothetical protein